MKKSFKYTPLAEETSIFLPSVNTTTELRIEPGPPPRIGLNVTTNPSKYPWPKWLMFGHILTLYVTVFILYSQIKFLEENMTEYNLNSINITLKNMQFEINCLKEIEHLKKIFKDHIGLKISEENNEVQHRNIVKRDLITSKNNGESDITLSTTADYAQLSVLKIPDNTEGIGRGGKTEKKRKNARRHCHGVALVANFNGAVPEPTIRDGGIINPWFKDKESAGEFGLRTNFTSTGKEMIEIVEGGLYFIHAQVYYLGSKADHHSFTIILIPKESHDNKEIGLAFCSTVGPPKSNGETSCYTSVVRRLSPGDRLFIRQRERDVYITMRPGQTFLSFVLLNRAL